MAFIEWEDRFRLGVDIKSIDEQHLEIFGLINQLYNGMKTGAGVDVARSVLRELISYAKYHFSQEELLFELHKYPCAQKHKESHVRLLEEIVNFKKRFDEGEVSISMEVLKVFDDWATIHILKEDIPFSNFLRDTSKGTTPLQADEK